MSRIFFLGAGKMATAIAGGLVRSGRYSAEELTAFDVSPEAAKLFTGNTQVACATTDPARLAAEAEAVLLAVKPQMLVRALEPLQGTLTGKPVLSIVAGVPITRLSELTGSGRVIRIMPNTPALVGMGAAGFAPGPDATAEDEALADNVLSAVGLAFRTEEKYLDAVTALSGSGPAYVFAFIQALADGGVAEGLPRDMATRLAAQTVLGSAEMVLRTGIHPTVLKDQVTSPAGTTSRALEALENGAFAGTVIAAVRAAARRSEELGRN